MKFINLTGHNINLAKRDGVLVIPGDKDNITKVDNTFSEFDEDQCCYIQYGEVSGLPPAEPDTLYIVSALVLSAVSGLRDDVVAPATGHPECKKNEKGHVLSVPGFVRR